MRLWQDKCREQGEGHRTSQQEVGLRSVARRLARLWVIAEYRPVHRLSRLVGLLGDLAAAVGGVLHRQLAAVGEE